jgi:hypothetical protein
MKNTDNKETILAQFNELMDKAKAKYPNIDESISFYNNITAHTKELNDYLNLTFQPSLESSSNQVAL